MKGRARDTVHPDVFRDREEAGRRLAAELEGYATMHPFVIGVPRGGVPVACEVARALHAPLDIRVARKIGVPWYPELGVGAVAEGGSVHLNHRLVDRIGLSCDRLADLVSVEQRELEERVRILRGDRPRPDLRGRLIIAVDDGIATGSTVHAVLHSIRAEAPKAIIVAVPVAASEPLGTIAPEVERLVCLRIHVDLHAIGLWYADFRPVSDEEIARLLERARGEPERAKRPRAAS
jgi:putative phosphoribosyl transferase